MLSNFSFFVDYLIKNNRFHTIAMQNVINFVCRLILFFSYSIGGGGAEPPKQYEGSGPAST